MSIAFSSQAQELVKMLQADQEEYKAFSRKYYWHDNPHSDAAIKSKAIFRKHAQARAKRMLEILEEVGSPSITNLGEEAAQAISILATHSSLKNTHKVLAAFEACYTKSREDTYYQAIPSMTDWAMLLARKSQQFGTIWLFDKNKQPYLPTVEDFGSVNKRRTTYDLEALRWPKSLAIPESEQPWIKQPLSQLVMREPTDEEYNEFASDFVEWE